MQNEISNFIILDIISVFVLGMLCPGSKKKKKIS